MADSVATVWVPVDDMERAVTFYGQTLSLQVKDRGADWSEIDAGNLMIGLNAREGTSARVDGGAVITFSPEGGIDAEVARLTRQGVEFTGGISDHEWGRIALFKDSESLSQNACPAVGYQREDETMGHGSRVPSGGA